VVLWEDDRHGNSDVYAYRVPTDLSTPGEECAIASGPSEQRKVAVSGDTVVWQDNRSGRWEIYSAKIPANCSTPAAESLVSTGEGNKTNPDISGNTIVWQDDRNGLGSSDIYAKDLSTNQEFPVSTGASLMDTPAISGSVVVWRQESPNNYDIFGRDLMARDLETGEVFQITSNSGDQVAPAISGNIVVWEDHRNGDADIYGKDLSTGVEFQVTSGAAPTTSPQINGETVVWESRYQGVFNHGNHDVLGTNLDTAPGTPSGATAIGSPAGVSLSWATDPESDIVGYNVYRSGSADGTFEKLNTTSVLSTPSYSDASAPKGEVSYYRVTAVDRGNESAPSAAVGAAALAQTSISLEVVPPRVDLGEATRLSGKLMRGDVPLSGKPLVIEQRPAGRNTFSPVAGGNVTTGSDGSFLLANVKPQGDTSYRVTYAGDASSGLLASTSPTKLVDVLMPSSLSLIASPLKVNYGSTTTLSGKMTKNGAAIAGKQVFLEHRPVGATLFTSLGVRTTSASGGFSFAGVKPAKNTDYRVRFKGDAAAKLLPSTSSVKRVGALMPTSASLGASPSSLTFGQATTLSGKLA
jgi:beta propeller repeat protein